MAIRGIVYFSKSLLWPKDGKFCMKFVYSAMITFMAYRCHESSFLWHMPDGFMQMISF